VLEHPAPTLRVRRFDDFGVAYLFRVWMSDYGKMQAIRGQVMRNLWYKLKRKGIQIPVPLGEAVNRAVPLWEKASSARRELELGRLREALSRVDFLQPLTPEELEALVARLTPEYYGPAEILCRQGEQGDSCFIVLEGEVHVLAHREGGADRFITSLKSGDLFGEISLLTGERRTATAKAVGQACLVRIGRDTFRSTLLANPRVAETIGGIVSDRLAQTREELAKILPPREVEVLTDRRAFMSRLRSFFALR
jgi:CRP-like cAMP-binding protein